MRSLYERIGGQPAVKTLVNAFYRKVFTDPLIGPFFVNTSLEKLTRMQEEFFTIALGGPAGESEFSVRKAHHGLGIKHDHIARFTDHLLVTLKEVGVDPGDANDIVARIAASSNEVIADAPTDD